MRLRLAALLAAVAVSGCGSGERPAHGTLLHVTERDFRIAAPASVRAGDVVLAVRNRGPVAHELIVVREDGGRLPLRRDGATVDEEALDPQTAGALEPADAGAARDLRVRLTPGRYVLFCNMSGHYLGGMHAELVVR
jgi:uncharacterized cupredoxin-like copper-binding protein